MYTCPLCSMYLVWLPVNYTYAQQAEAPSNWKLNIKVYYSNRKRWLCAPHPHSQHSKYLQYSFQKAFQTTKYNILTVKLPNLIFFNFLSIDQIILQFLRVRAYFRRYSLIFHSLLKYENGKNCKIKLKFF